MNTKALREGFAALWCDWTHGGGHVLRDPSGRVNWQCQKCGRWATPVPEDDERRTTDSALRLAQQAFREISHAHSNPGWFAGGERSATAHAINWARKGEAAVSGAISKSNGEPR